MKRIGTTFLTIGCFLLGYGTSWGSTAYGDLNNFDVVNDTGSECHGFEIELDDVRSVDITYTYDYNHYGVPKITEDDTDPLHPKTTVRYAGVRNADGTWTAYTAIPSGPIAPTQGHQFTDPTINFGGEHFGVGYYGAPSATKYFWLLDDGTGSLVHGPSVNIATPTFVYSAPVVGVAPAQVQAAIVLPPPEVPPAREFGEATWVKAIKTTSHNANKVALVDLVSDDPNNPNDRNWKNGEPDEVEVEWQLMQTEFAAANGGVNGELQNGAEDLPNGDEVITRRYEFYKYTGPIDPETGEALAENVAPDGIHGIGNTSAGGVSYDLSTMEVVGDYIGAQMSGFDAAAPLGLIDHLQDGELGVAYVNRTVVVGGNFPYLASVTAGALPDGMELDSVTGILSGTPNVGGQFQVTIEAVDGDNHLVHQTYALNVVAPPPVVVISDLVFTDITSSSATVTWTTSVPSTSQLLVDGAETVVDPNMVTVHALILDNLQPLTSYSVVGISVTGDGVSIQTAPATLTTADVPAVDCSISNATITFVNKWWLDVVVHAGDPVTHVVYTPTADGTVFEGVVGFAVGELVDYTGTLDGVGMCHASSMTVKPAPSPLVISPASLDPAVVGQLYTAMLSASGGLLPSGIVSVDGLPADWSWDGAVLSGVPIDLSPIQLQVTAMDARGLTVVQPLTIQVTDVPIVFTPVLPSGLVGAPYQVILADSGGYGGTTFSASGLPAGLTLTGDTIGGIPTKAGTFQVTLLAMDALGTSSSVTVSLVIQPAPSYTVRSTGEGRIQAIGDHYLIIKSVKIFWDANTRWKMGSHAQRTVGAEAQWRGLLDPKSGNVLASTILID